MSRRDYEPGRVTPGRLYSRANVTIVKVRGGRVHATVADHGVWSVKYRRGVWACDCGLTQPCNHQAAVALVCHLPKGERHLDWGES
jgi:hypothetical protein